MSTKSLCELERQLERWAAWSGCAGSAGPCIPSPTNRCRAIEIESCSRSSGGLRRKKPPSSTRPSPPTGAVGAPRSRSWRAERESACRGKKPARRPAEVAVRVTDAEVRAFEDRDRQSSSRTMRVGLDCVSALMTISSTFTCSGRVSANDALGDVVRGQGSTPSYVFFARSTSPRKRTMENSDSTSPGSASVSQIGRPSRSSRRAYVKPRTANFDAT